MKDFVIYTAIVGNYDEVHQPLIVDDRFDYILYSNDVPEKKIGAWQVRPIPYHNEIQTKTARWVKTHPEYLLPEYKSSLWIDANITIASSEFYEKYIKCLQEQTPIASIKHPERNCTYDEGIVCISLLIEKETIVLKWLHKLSQEGFPKRFGLFETNIMFRNHEKSQVVDELWWHCIEGYSRRDQLSFCYSLWKTGIKCDYFLPKKETARNSQNVKLSSSHKNTTNKSIPFTFGNYPFLRPFIKSSDCKRPWDMNLTDYYTPLYKHSKPIFRANIIGTKYLLKWLFTRPKEILFSPKQN